MNVLGTNFYHPRIAIVFGHPKASALSISVLCSNGQSPHLVSAEAVVKAETELCLVAKG